MAEEIRCACGEVIQETKPGSGYWVAKGYEVCKDNHWHAPVPQPPPATLPEPRKGFWSRIGQKVGEAIGQAKFGGGGN